jgi:hypothetical protein
MNGFSKSKLLSWTFSTSKWNETCSRRMGGAQTAVSKVEEATSRLNLGVDQAYRYR